MTMMSVVFLFFYFGAVLAALPDGWSACKQSSADYEDCLKKQIANAITDVKNGNKKLGVFPLDPLRFESMMIEQGTGPVSIKLLYKDVDFIGLSKLKVNSIKNNWKKMTIKYHMDRFVLNSKYYINGKILVLPIAGNGTCNIKMDDISSVISLDLEVENMNGNSYLQIKKMLFDFSPKNITFNFNGLFKGNKALGDNMNKFLNENWQVVIKELKPAISRGLEIGYTQYINRILAKIPAKDINLK